MHFHLPKPLHGWREFVGEVGIIVIGVLIALAAEQAVERIHWRDTVADEKVALDRDVETNWNAVDARRIIEPCVSRRLGEIARLIERHDSGQPLGLTGPIGRPAVWVVADSALSMASADGTLAHMTVPQRDAYFQLAQEATAFERAAWDERASWRILDRLNNAPALDTSGWRDIRNAYNDAVDSDTVMKANLAASRPEQWLWGFRRFRSMPRNRAALKYPQVAALCRPVVR